MKRLASTIRYLVPKHQYCNHDLAKSTPNTRCRFCTDLGKGLFVCVLHNEPLLVEQAKLILKTPRCLKASQFCKTEIEDMPRIPPRELVRQAVLEYRKIYQQLMADGIPEPLADKYAREAVIKEDNHGR